MLKPGELNADHRPTVSAVMRERLRVGQLHMQGTVLYLVFGTALLKSAGSNST